MAAQIRDRHTIPLAENLAMEFAWIPPGEFWMGTYEAFDLLSDESKYAAQPRHRVVISEGFWLQTTPVTQAQYQGLVELAQAAGACMDLDARPSHFKDQLEHPVEQVSWDDCQSLLEGLAKSEVFLSQLPSDFEAGLPSEAQWEYACRAETETDYWNGDGESALAEVGWFGEDWAKGSTHPVGELNRPNGFGLHDMHGNVWEWCTDVWDANAYSKRVDGWKATAWTEADAASNGSRRVLRGGSWYNHPSLCRSAIRSRDRPGLRFRRFGFRLCVSSGSGGQPAKPSQRADRTAAGAAAFVLGE